MTAIDKNCERVWEMTVYAERTLVVYKFMFNKRRHPDEVCSIYDLDGSDILTHFSKFLNFIRLKLLRKNIFSHQLNLALLAKIVLSTSRLLIKM